jgi:hypothetical protein
MNDFLKALLPGVAASILFWFLDRSLFGLAMPLRVAGMVIVLIVITALSLQTQGLNGKRRKIMSDRQIGGDSETSLGPTIVAGDNEVDLLSGDNIKGNAKISIDRLDIE